MRKRNRWFLAVFALAGIVVCLAFVLGFVREISSNGLVWPHDGSTAPDHYRAVGQSFSQGFAVGFFLCLFLCFLAFAVGRRVAWSASHGPRAQRARQQQ